VPLPRSALSVVLLLGASVVGPAQEAPTFREEVEVRVMDVDVVVTDRSGRPVKDLRREDFTVLLSGKPVPIDYFARVDEGAIRAPDFPTAAPDQVVGVAPTAEKAYVPRYFLIYVDLGHLALDARRRALVALRDFVTTISPTDRARIVMFDRRPKTLTGWSSSKEELFAGMNRIENAGVGMSRLITEKQTLHELDFAAALTSAHRQGTQSSLVEHYAEQERAEVRQLLEDVRSELTNLAPLAGKKVFLFVSGGFEYQPGYAMSIYVLGRPVLLGSRNFTEELNAIVRRANSSEITFYTVDARGMEVGGLSATQFDEPLLSRPSISTIARQDSQEGLVMLARETGGLALINSNDLEKGLSRIHEDTSVYYSLGVTLSKLPASKYQQIRVEVNRPGVTVRTRQGYSALTETERAQDRVEATMKTNLSYSAIPVVLRTAPASRAGGSYTLPISVTFPASALTFVPDGRSVSAAADFWFGAVDDEGRSSDVAHEQTTFAPSGGAPDAPLIYRATLRLRKGANRVIVNVRDRATGKMGTAKANVKVG